jgi:predicted RNA-binding Zn-ribbon protein involved in translation (DUF1610 family)
MRLIDADALGVGRCSRDVLPADYCAVWNGLIRLLEKAPTVDAVPVVHGRWNNMDGYKTRKVCSECGWDVPEYGKFYSYCPNCGAKMDGGAENASKEM